MSSRRKALGQHFLSDPAVARGIVDGFGPGRGDRVLEIGPGRGALTDLLADSGAFVMAVEKDPNLARLLAERYASRRNVRVVQGDVLEVTLEDLPFPRGGSVRVLSNLPYSSATAILRKLLAWSRIGDLTVMVQREVADRIQAGPGSRDRGYLSVLVQVRCRVDRLLEVGPGAFRPRPKVRSAVVRLRPRESGGPRRGDLADLLALAAAGFAHRRKTLYNNLKVALDLSARGWEAVCRSAGVDPRARAEDLDIDAWWAMLEALDASGLETAAPQ